MATEFVGQGATVTLLDMRSPDEIRDLIADLRTEYRQVDVRDPDAVGEVVDRLAPMAMWQSENARRLSGLKAYWISPSRRLADADRR